MMKKPPHNIGTPDQESESYEQEEFEANNKNVSNKRILDGMEMLLNKRRGEKTEKPED